MLDTLSPLGSVSVIVTGEPSVGSLPAFVTVTSYASVSLAEKFVGEANESTLNPGAAPAAPATPVSPKRARTKATKATG